MGNLKCGSFSLAELFGGGGGQDKEGITFSGWNSRVVSTSKGKWVPVGSVVDSITVGHESSPY